jgi:hypothetical protein
MSFPSPPTPELRTGRINLGMKVAFSLFMAAHLWINLHYYGPLNYLWFCDLALIVCLIGVWLDNGVLLGMAALASVGPSVVWSLDLFWKLAFHHWLVGMAGYVFYREIPLPVRLMATFHLWLPLLIFCCLFRVGYDRRALIYQTVLAISLLIVCRIISNPPPPRGPSDNTNINFVYGNSEVAPTPLPAWLYIPKMVLGYWFLMYLPTHIVLVNLFCRNQRPLSSSKKGDKDIIPPLKSVG